MNVADLLEANKHRSVRADVARLFQEALDQGRTALMENLFDRHPAKIFDGAVPSANCVGLRYGKGLCFANTSEDVVVRLDELTGIVTLIRETKNGMAYVRLEASGGAVAKPATNAPVQVPSLPGSIPLQGSPAAAAARPTASPRPGSIPLQGSPAAAAARPRGATVGGLPLHDVYPDGLTADAMGPPSKTTETEDDPVYYTEDNLDPDYIHPDHRPRPAPTTASSLAAALRAPLTDPTPLDRVIEKKAVPPVPPPPPASSGKITLKRR